MAPMDFLVRLELFSFTQRSALLRGRACAAGRRGGGRRTGAGARGLVHRRPGARSGGAERHGRALDRRRDALGRRAGVQLAHARGWRRWRATCRRCCAPRAAAASCSTTSKACARTRRSWSPSSGCRSSLSYPPSQSALALGARRAVGVHPDGFLELRLAHADARSHRGRARVDRACSAVDAAVGVGAGRALGSAPLGSSGAGSASMCWSRPGYFASWPSAARPR